MKHSEKMSVQFLSDIDPCHPNPCQNDGICKDVQGKVQCECKPPHKGTFCTGQFLVTRAWDASYIPLLEAIVCLNFVQNRKICIAS